MTSANAVTGKAWRQLRRHLLQGSSDGAYRKESLPDGILRYSSQLPREDIISILQAESATLPQAEIKTDHKRSTSRVWLRERPFVLKTYHRLRRWLPVSADSKGWLGAHRLNNGVPCYAWFRKHDRSMAVIIYADAGNRDLHCPEWSRQIDDNSLDLFQQAGAILADLHRQNVFHADTKPSNFVYQDSSAGRASLHLIDTDDVRIYRQLSQRRRLKNLAQFMGCSRDDVPKEAYLAAFKAFFYSYMRSYPCTPDKLHADLPLIEKNMALLYPQRELFNQTIVHELAKDFHP
jgi:hypothetical protein